MEQMFTLRDFQAATGLSKSAVFKRLREGRFPRTIKLGRRRLIPASAYDQWLAAELGRIGAKEGVAEMAVRRPEPVE